MLKLYLNPSFWFLPEDQKKRTILKHTLSGEELDRALAKLDNDGQELDLALLELDLKYSHITPYDYHVKIINIKIPDTDSDESKLALLELDREFEKVDIDEYEKGVATINNEPWKKIDFVEEEDGKWRVELDYNEAFVEDLANKGFQGIEADEIIDDWFTDFCRVVTYEALYDEEGNPRSFDSDSKEGLIHRSKMDNDRAEYS